MILVSMQMKGHSNMNFAQVTHIAILRLIFLDGEQLPNQNLKNLKVH
jgi:hypothetical protein